MKPRRVFIMLELETKQPLSVLRDRNVWDGGIGVLHQVQVNVARKGGPVKKYKAKSKGKPKRPC